MDHYNDRGNRSYNTSRPTGRSPRRPDYNRQQQNQGFFSQQMSLSNIIFAPEGYEEIVLALYFVTLPYLAGLLFLFLFIAEAKYEHFLSFNVTSFMVIWAIGYEVCAILIMAIIFLAWIRYLTKPAYVEPPRKKTNIRYDR